MTIFIKVRNKVGEETYVPIQQAILRVQKRLEVKPPFELAQPLVAPKDPETLAKFRKDWELATKEPLEFQTVYLNLPYVEEDDDETE